jgi:Excalibur calcium-binding domain
LLVIETAVLVVSPSMRGLVLALAAASILALAALSFGYAAGPAGAQVPRKYPNCKALNAKYPHGVGRVGARDKTKSGDRVTTFRRSNRLYELNKGLDRDKDRIACEKE